MKTKQKKLFSALFIGVSILLFFIGGCKKELTSTESIPKISNLSLSGETVDQLKNKKLRLVRV